MVRLGTALLLAAAVSGCATTYGSVEAYEAAQVEKLVVEVRNAAASGNQAALGTSVRSAIKQNTGATRMRETLTSTPKAREMLTAYFETATAPESVDTAQQAMALRTALNDVRSAQLLDPLAIDRLSTRLAKTVTDGASSGSLQFTLADAESFPELGSNDMKRRLVDRTVASLAAAAGPLAASTDRAASLKALSTYATSADAAERDRVQGALAKASLRRGDISHIAAVFPALATELQMRLYVPTKFSLKGGDRLLQDDLRGIVGSKIKGVSWVADDAPAPVSIAVERVRHEERSSGERRETITYAQHEVNLIAAALLMPRNASYSYDVLSSERSIEYGYVASVERPGTPRFEKVVRGTLSSEDVTCSNARIQNVFGGVTSAGFVANDDMTSRCNKGRGRSMDELRAAIFSEIAEALATAPQLKEAASPD